MEQKERQQRKRLVGPIKKKPNPRGFLSCSPNTLSATNAGGFTMAELLAVVAILAVLMAIAGVAVSNYLRDLTLTEYDNTAKSIYIAAQNNMTDLRASGEWTANAANAYAKTSGNSNGAGPTAPTAKRTDDNGATENDNLTYYYINAETARDNGILPAGTIDETVRGNDFVIEYCYETATVYGVFYTKTTNNGKTLISYYQQGIGTSGIDVRAKEARRDNNPVVGYYGGASATDLEHATLTDPIVATGRSSKAAITDQNLKTQPSAKTALVVTFTDKTVDAGKTASTVSLALSKGLAGTAQVQLVKDGNAKTLTDTSFCTLSDITKSTYTLDLAAMKNNAELSSLFTEFKDGDEFLLTAKCVSSAVLCRPAYAYGSGMWSTSTADIEFTSNLIADYETEADIYVYRSIDNNGTTENVAFNLENWYNDATFAKEDLYYEFDQSIDSRIVLGRITTNNAYAYDVDRGEKYLYSYAPIPGGINKLPQRMTFYVTGANSLTENDVLPLKVNVYKAGTTVGNERTPTSTLLKTLTINVHVMNAQRDWNYRIEDHGSYFEVVVMAGSSATPFIRIASNIAAIADWSNPRTSVRSANGNAITLNSIAAGGSASVKFFKTDTRATLSDGAFSFSPTPTS